LNKAPDAFRTISEVADDLDLPQHVLRFWESRFPQIRPMKRGGGRRYYRPEDIDLLRGIRHLLYGEGYTIRGVQRILREQGLRTVQSVGQGRAVTLPEPSHEDAADGEHETDAGPDVLPFTPSLFSGPAADDMPSTRHAEVRGEGDAGALRAAAAPLRGDVADTESDAPSHVPAQAPPQAAVPVVAGLAPEDLDRLKTALRGLEECRRMLDGAGGS
jgi:DNA-binding transcriptional MerR regulator